MGCDLSLKPVGHDNLSRLKWEYEAYRTGYKDLLCMGTADMDFMSPEPILQAICSVAGRGHLGYPMIPESYYEAIHNWLLRKASWKIDPIQSVCHNEGVYLSGWNVLDVLTNPGDKITILSPVHFCFRRMVDMNRRVVIECPLIQRDGRYTVDAAALESCLASGTKLLWICNPHNPVGRAWSRAELQMISDLCLKYDVYLLSDDVYCGLTFPEAKYVPIASLSKEISYRTVTLYSTSKTFNTTGLLHSYIVTENPEIMKRYMESMDRLDTRYSVDIMGIYALISAYNECDGWLEQLQRQLQKNYQTILDYFAEHVPDAPISKADATYFAWIDMRKLGIDPQKLGYMIEEEQHIILENGLRCGKGGAGFIRLNTATSQDNILEAMERLNRFWKKHKNGGKC